MKRVYAVAESVPDSTPYLTAGKRYVADEDGPRAFYITDDEGDTILCGWKFCANLEGGDWTRIEVDEPDSSEIAAELAEALALVRDNMRKGVAGHDVREGWLRANATLAKWEASK